LPEHPKVHRNHVQPGLQDGIPNNGELGTLGVHRPDQNYGFGHGLSSGAG
jgi:hypothetical protein